MRCQFLSRISLQGDFDLQILVLIPSDAEIFAPQARTVVTLGAKILVAPKNNRRGNPDRRIFHHTGRRTGDGKDQQPHHRPRTESRKTTQGLRFRPKPVREHTLLVIE